MPPYSIDYYQVNAGTGDCEILLLLKDKAVEKAVLIDGGEPTAYYLANIRKTFATIRKTYGLKELKFDAIVITHWDDDHYRGIFELMSQDLDKGQVSWLKYTNAQPDSVLYIPYRFSTSRGNFTYSPDGLYLCLEKMRLCKVVSDSKEGSPTLPPTPQPLNLGDSDLIGRELFKNLHKMGNAGSPDALVKIYSGDLKDQPGLFCVAANYRYLKPTGGFTSNKDEDASPTNKSSIVCLVIWPDDRRITHYLAGDAPLALEEAVMKWTGYTTAKGKVQVVKASNHGARTSFPLALCQKFKPSYILCSAGRHRSDQVEGHEYPNWEFMFKVYSSMATIWDMFGCQIFFTNFPYYLQDGVATKFSVEKNSLLKGSLHDSLSPALKKYPGTDPGEWVRSVLANIVLPRFAWYNDDCSPKEAADARDDIQFILIKSPAGTSSKWLARVERLSSKRRATEQGPPRPYKSLATFSIPGSPTTSVYSSLITQDQPASDIFYVTSSSETTIPPHVAHGVADINWKDFIGALSSGYIILSASPGPKAVKLENGDDFLDPWLGWLANLLNAMAVDISVDASLSGQTVTINHFELSMALYFGKQITLTFHPGNKVGPKSDIPGPFDPYKHFLHFGLENSDPSKVTLWDLILFYQFSENTVWFKSDLPFDLNVDKCDVWLGAALGYYSGTFRLQASSTTNLSDFVKGLKVLVWDEGLVPEKVTMVVKRTIALLESGDGDLPRDISQLGFAFHFEKFDAILFCSSESYLIAFRWPSGAIDALENILKKAGCDNFKSTLDKIAKSRDILGASVEIRKGTKLEILQVTVDVEITLGLGSNDVPFLLTFAYPQFLFRASLITTEDTWQKMMPDYEPLLEVVLKRKPKKGLSIADFIPGIENIPQGIPDKITQATFQLDDSTVSFLCTLKSDSMVDGEDEPKIPIISLSAAFELSASYRWSPSPSWSLSIAVTVRLDAKPAGDSLPNAEEAKILYASVDYDSNKKWKLTGGLSDITFGDLLVFFDENERDQVKDMLGSIRIPSIFLSYEYDKGKSSHFVFDGSIAIHDNKLHLKYSRDQDGWDITADLMIAADYTLMDLLGDIGHGKIKDELPDFFEKIKLTPQKMSLTCAKRKNQSPDSALITTFNVMNNLKELSTTMSFTFVQISHKPNSATIPVTKRLLSLEFTNLLPSLKLDMPLFGPLKNPIDGLELLWVNEPKESGKAFGLTKKEIKEIKDDTGTVIRSKETKVSVGDNDILITAGCHFMLLVNDCGRIQVALDYAFSSKNKKIVSTHDFALALDPAPPSQSKAAINKTVGPLSVTNIGLQYQSGSLLVVFDASLSLGPVSLSLLGFGLGVELNSDLFRNPKFHAKFDGLAAGLNKPPLSLDGLFKKVDRAGDEIYSGGLIISVEPYGVLAFGSYGKLKNNMMAFFIFGQLEGPLVELGFATIDGVKLGFGYNYHLTYPTVDNVVTFPLVQGIKQGVIDKAENDSNVLTILGSFDKWLQPQQNSLWFAAGLEVTAFKSLHINAVAVVEVDPDISLGLFAKVDFFFPPKGPRRFVYAELGIACRLIFKEGLFIAEASLSPNSYVLDPSCRLSGGMSLCYWFEPSPHAGDFVFSIGGYHAAYQAPSYYPKPQRLGIAWRLNDNIHIEGNAYFAITPKVCMGGGKLDLRFSASPVYAYFTAHADFFIVWSPFYFMADIGVSIGGGIRGKFMWCDVDISIDVSADLHLEGPPFCGHVRIETFIKDIYIHFGDPPGPPARLTLNEFWELLLSESPGDKQEGPKDGITLAIESGGLPGENDKAKVETHSDNQSWDVAPGSFSFIVQCRFALQEVEHYSVRVIPETGTIDVYSKPMQSTESITSKLTITIHDTDNKEVKFTCKPIWKNAPSAQWGKYSADNDPTQGTKSSYLRNGMDSTVKTLMGAQVIGPRPKWAEDGIPAYSVADAMCEDIFPQPRPLPHECKARPKPWKNETLKDAKAAWLKQSKVQDFTNKWRNGFDWKAELVGKQPEYLLDNFEAFYLYVPMSTTKP